MSRLKHALGALALGASLALSGPSSAEVPQAVQDQLSALISAAAQAAEGGDTTLLDQLDEQIATIVQSTPGISVAEVSSFVGSYIATNVTNPAVQQQVATQSTVGMITAAPEAVAEVTSALSETIPTQVAAVLQGVQGGLETAAGPAAGSPQPAAAPPPPPPPATPAPVTIINTVENPGQQASPAG